MASGMLVWYFHFQKPGRRAGREVQHFFRDLSILCTLTIGHSSILPTEQLTSCQIFLRAIGANWLVCLAVFLSISAREISSKIIAIWFPTACFVGLALDHVVANMFFMPMGIWCGAPFSVGYYIWKSMIPTGMYDLTGNRNLHNLT